MLLLEIIIALVMVPSSLKAITDTDLLQLDGASEENANSQRASQGERPDHEDLKEYLANLTVEKKTADEEFASTIPRGDALPGIIMESLTSDLSSSDASSKDLGRAELENIDVNNALLPGEEVTRTEVLEDDSSNSTSNSSKESDLSALKTTLTPSSPTSTTVKKEEAPLPDKGAAEEEKQSSMTIFFILIVLALCILVVHLLLITRFHYLPESIAIVFLGGLIGARASQNFQLTLTLGNFPMNLRCLFPANLTLCYYIHINLCVNVLSSHFVFCHFQFLVLFFALFK